MEGGTHGYGEGREDERYAFDGYISTCSVLTDYRSTAWPDV
jgi:hypothetical protein